MPHWVTFQDPTTEPVCVALAVGGDMMARHVVQEQTGKIVDKVYSLPYPASPCILNETGCPTFCMHGDICKGRSSCPRNYACSE